MATAPNPTRPFARPAFPVLQQSPSANSSTFQSYSSTTSLASQSPASAPLPSPSQSTHPEQQGFFSSLNQQQAQQQQQQQQMQHAQQQQVQNVQSPPTFTYQPNRQGAGQTAAETTSFLNQTALLAEAAKRAQMAVLMRDVEGMEL